LWLNNLDLVMLDSDEVPKHCKEVMVYNIEVCDATEYREVDEQKDKAIEQLVEALNHYANEEMWFESTCLGGPDVAKAALEVWEKLK